MLQINEMYFDGRKVAGVKFKRTRSFEILHALEEEEGLDLVNTDPRSEYNKLCENHVKFKVSHEPLNEMASIEFVIGNDREKLKHKPEVDIVKVRNRYKSVNILFIEHDHEFEDITPWILVELPKPVGDVKYVPVFLLENGTKRAVCVHPDYHTIFLRNFTNQERHQILGFIYLYGYGPAGWCRAAYLRGYTKVLHSDEIQMNADYYVDERDAPDRIPTFKYPAVKGTTYEFIFDQYEEWAKIYLN